MSSQDKRLKRIQMKVNDASTQEINDSPSEHAPTLSDNMPAQMHSEMSKTRIPDTPALSDDVLAQLQAEFDNEFAVSLPVIPAGMLTQVPLQIPDTPTTPIPLSKREHSLPGISADALTQVPVQIPDILTTPVPLSPRAQPYAEWLATQARREAKNDQVREINAYIKNATQPVQVKGKDIAIFAPYRPELSALQTFTAQQVGTLIVIALLLGVGFAAFRLSMVTAIVALITFVYLSNFVLNFFMAVRAFQHSPEVEIDEDVIHELKHVDWPKYTILCPLYKEAQVVPQFVHAMQALDYPQEKLQILFLTEANDSETRDAIRALSLPAYFKIVTVPDGKPRTKPRACNYGLMQTMGSYVVIYDAEDTPDPLQLKKSVLAFASKGPEVACVQAKLNFYNPRQNVLTRWFTAEYSTWFDMILPGLQQIGFPVPLGGTSNHFRTAALRALGGWDAYNVTEDCDLGLRLTRYRMKTIVLNSTTYEEANSQVKNWIRQRSRWIKGYMQTYLVHMRHPFEYLQKRRLYDLFSFQVVVGSGTSVLFLNPLMWLLLAAYAIFRPWVGGVYSVLFPTPILYAGLFCLIFGNFFYIYLYLLACVKRKQYYLMLSTLFIPFYWALISVAAMMALYELVVKPHYWQKTVHGLHLQGAHAMPEVTWEQAKRAVEDEPTIAMSALSRNRDKVADTPTVVTPSVTPRISIMEAIPSVTMSLKAISTLPMPAFSAAELAALLRVTRAKARDGWFSATPILALLISIVACVYFFRQHDLLLYRDAYTHMRIARAVFDSTVPGIKQFGGVWLPLSQVLMLPFIWNDYLWHTGLAGSIPSMLAYVVTATYLFLIAKRLTHDSRASFVGVLVFLINPNVLYLQVTPLNEILCIAGLVVTCYYMLAWIQQESSKFLILAAVSTFLATLVRYDGWALFLVVVVLIALVGWLKGYRWSHNASNVLIFMLPGGLGIGLWVLWNKLIFNDPLYFLHQSLSLREQLLPLSMFYTYHNLWESVRYYSFAVVDILGPMLSVLLLLGMFAFVARRRVTSDMLVVIVLLAPFAFYALAFAFGNIPILVPEAVPANAPYHLFNVRYGVQMVAPAAILLAILAHRFSRLPVLRYWSLGYLVLVAAICTQAALTTRTGVVSLQDGQYGNSCMPSRPVTAYLARHYTGGKILEDVSATGTSFEDAGIDLKNVIYEGSGPLWEKAQRNPAATANWVVIQTGDSISQHTDVYSPVFLSQFTFVMQESDGMQLYHRRGEPLLTISSASNSILNENPACKVAGS